MAIPIFGRNYIINEQHIRQIYSDLRYGRKIANIGSVLFSFLGAIAMAAAPNAVIFVILRTIMAMGLGGGQNGPVTLGESDPRT